MTERLVDVIDMHDMVLQTYAVTIDPPLRPTDDRAYKTKALTVAAQDCLVADAERGEMSARMHVSRGGALQPFGCSIKVQQQRISLEQRVRETAYLLWEASGSQDHSAASHWGAAHELLLKKRAYEIWEHEGRPDGQADSIWRRASQDAYS